MTGSELKTRVARGVAWIGLASSAVGILDLVALAIILKLWVTKADLGIATLAAAWFPILDQATDLGLSSAVVQKDDHTPEKISTVFWLNLMMGVLLFGALALAAPLYGRLHGHAVVAWLLTAYGTKLLFQNVYAIPHAMMKRELRFKELSVIRIIANCAEFAGKVGFAAAGYTIWCFILGPLCRVLVTGIGVQLRHPWRPRFVLRLAEAASYLKFGLKTSTSQILFYFYTNVDYVVVGTLFGEVSLGLYRAAYTLVLEPVLFMSEVIVQIAFPAFARLRGDRAALVDQFVAFTRQNLVVVLPFVAVILLAADDILGVVGFQAAAPAARILCAVGVLRALSFVIPPLLDGVGVPGLTLVYTAVAAVLLPGTYVAAGVLLGPRLGFEAVALAWAAGYPLAFGVLVWLVLGELELGLGQYLRRVARIPLWALVAGAAGLAARAAAASAPGGVRLGVVAAATLGVFFALLAAFEGISPWSIARAVRGEKPPGEQD